jgi:hypothetical protein
MCWHQSRTLVFLETIIFQEKQTWRSRKLFSLVSIIDASLAMVHFPNFQNLCSLIQLGDFTNSGLFTEIIY